MTIDVTEASQRYSTYALVRRLLLDEALRYWPRYAIAFLLMGITAAATALTAYLLGTMTNEAYVKGPLARLAGSPEDVAGVIAKAILASRPRTRYTVSASATLLLTLRRLLSDRLWDLFVGSSFPAPGSHQAS